jgi:hypothetical protein
LGRTPVVFIGANIIGASFGARSSVVSYFGRTNDQALVDGRTSSGQGEIGRARERRWGIDECRLERIYDVAGLRVMGSLLCRSTKKKLSTGPTRIGKVVPKHHSCTGRRYEINPLRRVRTLCLGIFIENVVFSPQIRSGAPRDNAGTTVICNGVVGDDPV